MFPRNLKKYVIIGCCISFCWIYFLFKNTGDSETIIDESDDSMYSQDENEGQISNRLADRHELIRYVCSQGNTERSLNSTRNHIYQADSRELLYCAAPGASSGFLLRVLVLTKPQDYDYEPVKSMLDPISADELLQAEIRKIPYSQLKHGVAQYLQKVDDYFKFMFVRNPFARILSIYLKKYSADASNKNVLDVELMKLIKKQQKEPQEPSISFLEFLRFVVDDVTNSSTPRFWRPIYDACAPCVIDYDIVGKMETFESDFKSCMEGINDYQANRAVRIITGQVMNEIARINEAFDKHWKTIPTELLNRFVEAYKMDFITFGYKTSLKDYLDQNGSSE